MTASDFRMDSLTGELQQLEQAELVRRLPEEEPAYLFEHALTQEAAYESLLLRKRREIHRLVAGAYEQLYPDHLDDYAALLAQHYAEAGDDEKSLVYALRAGDAAARVFAYQEASAHFGQALDALSRLPETERHELQRADTLLKQVSVSLRAEGPIETLKRLATAESLARRYASRPGGTRQDRLRLGRVYYWRGQALIHHNEARAAIQQLEEALQVARAENDPELLAIPASVIGRSLGAQGHFAQAVPVLADAIKALEQIHDEHEWVLATGFRGVALTMLGEYPAGIREAERALAHATEWNSPTDIAVAHGLLGMVHFFGDPLSPSGEHAQRMIETADRAGEKLYAYMAYGFLAWSEAREGDCASSQNDFERADAIAREIGGRLLFADWFAAARAEHALRCGSVEEALALSKAIVDQSPGGSGLFAVGLAERVQGQALARQTAEGLEDAAVHFEKSLAAFELGGARLETARTYLAWGQVLLERGNRQGAREHIEKAAAQFEASGSTAELEQTLRLLDFESGKE